MLPVPHLSPFPAAIPFLTEEQTSGFEGFGNPETAAGCQGGRFSGLAGAGQVILRGVWARPLALKPRVSSGLAGCSEVLGGSVLRRWRSATHGRIPRDTRSFRRSSTSRSSPYKWM